MDINQFLTYFTGELNKGYEEALAGLTDEELYFLPGQNTCHIAFHAWHFARTEDNVINFVCQDRKMPVWVRQALHEKWKLPKVSQGTGMAIEEARAMRLPGVDALVRYIRDTWADIEPYLCSVSREELQGIVDIRPWGDKTRLQHIGRTIIAHGNDHLGQIKTLRAIQGLQGDTF